VALYGGTRGGARGTWILRRKGFWGKKQGKTALRESEFLRRNGRGGGIAGAKKEEGWIARPVGALSVGGEDAEKRPGAKKFGKKKRAPEGGVLRGQSWGTNNSLPKGEKGRL